MRKPIKGYEKIYEISDSGEIIHIKTQHKSFGYKDKKGYLVFDFRRRGGKCVKVHRLVAETFIPNPLNLPQVNHKDGNKQNNCVENLEWCDNSYNQIHAFQNNLQKGNFLHPNSKLKYEDVVYIKNHYKKGVKNCGARTLAKKFNVTPASIFEIINGKSYKNIN